MEQNSTTGVFDEQHIYLAKSRKEIIALFFQSSDNPYHRPVHCINCGRIFISVTNGNVSLVSDSAGVPYKLSTEVRCGRCNTRYKLFL